MRIDRKESIRRLHVIALADAPHFARHRLLIAARADMLDDGVAHDDIERCVAELRKIARIAEHELKSRVAHRQIAVDDRDLESAAGADHIPKRRITTNIE